MIKFRVASDDKNRSFNYRIHRTQLVGGRQKEKQNGLRERERNGEWIELKGRGRS